MMRYANAPSFIGDISHDGDQGGLRIGGVKPSCG